MLLPMQSGVVVPLIEYWGEGVQAGEPSVHRYSASVVPLQLPRLACGMFGGMLHGVAAKQTSGDRRGQRLGNRFRADKWVES